jgi:hypothetical protein
VPVRPKERRTSRRTVRGPGANGLAVSRNGTRGEITARAASLRFSIENWILPRAPTWISRSVFSRTVAGWSSEASAPQYVAPSETRDPRGEWYEISA